MKNKLPIAAFAFGQRVTCTWHEAEEPPSDGFITAIRYAPFDGLTYTLLEDNGALTDGITEDMLSASVLSAEAFYNSHKHAHLT